MKLTETMKMKERMKITETIKSIIELIEPYMNKEFNDKCIVRAIGIDNNLYQYGEIKKFFNGHIKIVYETCTTSFNTENALQISNEKINFTDEFGQNTFRIKIIGHYDITSILQYIDNSYRDKRGMPHGDILVELTPDDIHINIREELYMLPMKPIHLYTEEEDKNLLELLKQLGATS